MNKHYIYRYIFFLLLEINIGKVFSHESENQVSQDEVVLEIVDLEVCYSEKGIIKAIGHTKKVLRYKNDDVMLPEGVDAVLYKENQQKATDITANCVSYSADKKVATLRGNVILKSCMEDRQLYTEELNYNIDSEEFYTDKAIKINNGGEILLGDGLQASKDFSTFSILNPQGNLNTEITD